MKIVKPVCSLVSVLLLVTTYYLYADTVSITNTSTMNLYIAAYYTSLLKDIRERATPVVMIKAGEQISFERPSLKIGYNTELAIDFYTNLLAERLSKAEYKNLMTGNMGVLLGKTFYIVYKDGNFTLYNQLEWKAIKPLVDAATKAFDAAVLSPIRNLSLRHLYAHQTANVRLGSSLSTEEQMFIARRKKDAIRRGIKFLTNIDVQEESVPTIGLCFSGGGMRAMLATVAFLRAANTIGLLDSALYITALSGSTWALGAWLASDQSIDEFRNVVAPKIEYGLATPLFTETERYTIAKSLITRVLYGQDVGLIDVWGILIGRKMISESDYKIGFSTLHSKVDEALVPLPICTAVADNIAPRSLDYTWFECTPYEFYSHYMKAAIPMWALGRTFINGISTNFAPELSLAYLLGIWGSAFAVGIGDILDNILPKEGPITVFTGQLLNKFKREFDMVNQNRIVSGAKLFNFARGLPGVPLSANKPTIELVDGGYSGNNPVPPLIRPERNVDIIVIGDFSATIKGTQELKKAVEYARIHNLKFPHVDFSIAEKQNISVFGDPKNPEELVIIYIPRIKNTALPAPYNQLDPDKETARGGFLNTFNMSYTPENAELWMGYIEHNVLLNKDVIKKVIAERVHAKQGQR